MKKPRFNRKHKVLHFLLKKKRPVILEIGAHIGADSKLFLDQWPEASLFCFEPDPRNIIILKRLNDYLGNKFHIIEMAVCDESGERNFYQTYKESFSDKDMKKHLSLNWVTREDLVNANLANSSSSSLKGSHPYTKNANIIKVKTTTLDKWVSENNILKIDLLWVDVQGAEKEVLNGSKKSLNNIDYIFIEYGETEYEGGMTRAETIEKLSDSFQLLEGFSSSAHKGDLFFVNKNIKLNKNIILVNKLLAFVKNYRKKIKRYS